MPLTLPAHIQALDVILDGLQTNPGAGLSHLDNNLTLRRIRFALAHQNELPHLLAPRRQA